MQRIKWRISSVAVLLFAAAYFFDDTGAVSAAVPAIAVHEFGHLLALYFSGKRISEISVSPFGLKIDYIGELAGGSAMLCIGAGPLLGLMYYVISLALGGKFMSMSGGISLVLSLFNLLPLLPLDGGRLLAVAAGMRRTEIWSKYLAVLLMMCGIILLFFCGIISLLIISVWLFLYNFRS